jgi:hypothetical protein
VRGHRVITSHELCEKNKIYIKILPWWHEQKKKLKNVLRIKRYRKKVNGLGDHPITKQNTNVLWIFYLLTLFTFSSNISSFFILTWILLQMTVRALCDCSTQLSFPYEHIYIFFHFHKGYANIWWSASLIIITNKWIIIKRMRGKPRNVVRLWLGKLFPSDISKATFHHQYINRSNMIIQNINMYSHKKHISFIAM